MVDRQVAGLEGTLQADVGRHVASEPDPRAVGDLVQGVESLSGEARMDLQEVVAGQLLMPNRAAGRIGAGDAVPVDGGSGGIDSRREEFAAVRLGAQLQVHGSAQHAADGRDPVGQVQQQDPLREIGPARLTARHVRVHLGEPRHQVLPLSVDPHGALRHAHLAGVADRHDAVAEHEDGLVRDDPLFVHRDDVHADEGVIRGIGRNRRTAGFLRVGGSGAGCPSRDDKSETEDGGGTGGDAMGIGHRGCSFVDLRGVAPPGRRLLF